jgi:hypothetical protein
LHVDFKNIIGVINVNIIKNQWPKPSQGRQKGKAKERPKHEQLT